MEICILFDSDLNPSYRGFLSFTDFISRIPRALKASIRSEKIPNHYSYMLHNFAVFDAVVNLMFVVKYAFVLDGPGHELHSSTWWDKLYFPLGCIVTISCALELFLRVNPGKFIPIVPTTSLNIIFEGLATAAVGVSALGE